MTVASLAPEFIVLIQSHFVSILTAESYRFRKIAVKASCSAILNWQGDFTFERATVAMKVFESPFNRKAVSWQCLPVCGLMSHV